MSMLNLSMDVLAWVAYLLVFVLLQITRGHQTLWVDVSGDRFNELRVRVHVLHLEEGQNVLDLQIVWAVGHGLPFGGQATCRHPVGVLFLLREETSKNNECIGGEKRRRGKGCAAIRLTVSHRSQISFIPSATGISSLMLNFWPEILTSGVTSQPTHKKARGETGRRGQKSQSFFRFTT